jgi:PAS domain S-box-containing protein
MKQPRTIDEIIATDEVPAIVASEQGLIEFINKRFTHEYGWTKKDLVGQPLTTIIPTYFRDTHRLGFARFLATEKATLLGKPMELAIQLKDGTVARAEHFIIGQKDGGMWRFGATIRQLEGREVSREGA